MNWVICLIWSIRFEIKISIFVFYQLLFYLQNEE